MKYELYGFLHKTAKKLLHKSNTTDSFRMISILEKNIYSNVFVDFSEEHKGSYINELSPVPAQLKKDMIFPIENIVSSASFLSFDDSFKQKRKCNENSLGIEGEEAENLWMDFIQNSVIPGEYRNGLLHYAGYILDCEEWCLPSWIWTNASLVRMFCSLGEIEKAKILADKLIELQQECGGWIVRNDYDLEGAVPILAPNDSAYIANNSSLEMYLATKNEKYLSSSIKCAEWIIKTARQDGMVFVGYDMKRNCWQTKHNIVDVGFTAGLFARLYECTKRSRYLEFLKKFVKKYIELFYIPSNNGFATSLDNNDKQIGGMFGRGQAWALEGLIPASKILNDEELSNVIQNTIDNLIKNQDRRGGWAYNLSRPLMGIDCKATSVIAFSLMKWYLEHPDQLEIKEAVHKAYKWCLEHTLSKGRGKGGIYSYTTEGAIVHHLYTWTAFVYGSSYAIELKKLLSDN